MRKKNLNIDLYLVTDRGLSLDRPLDWVVEKAVKGGTTIVQLREKDIETRDFIELAKKLKPILKRYNVPLLINDRIDIALATDADGVHLGQSDMPYQEARRLLGKDAIIGLSVESIEQAKEANEFEVDYVAISPVYTTPTKKELTQDLGLEGVKKISEISRHPSVGIGSIKKHNAGDVIKAGADGIAVVSGICSADDPQKAAEELLYEVHKAKNLAK
jgi:thiamine-phosphate pyrophosphorylase